MRFLRSLVGLLSLSLGMLLGASAVWMALRTDTLGPETSTLVVAILGSLLCVPFAFLAYFAARKVPAARLGFATLTVVGFLAATIVMGIARRQWPDLGSLMTIDPYRLKDLAVSLVLSPKATLVVYFGWALSMVFLGVMLRPIAAMDSAVKPFRTLLILSGLAQASIVGRPMLFALLPLTYCALGIFLLVTRIGIEPKSSLRFIDDYYPA